MESLRINNKLQKYGIEIILSANDEFDSIVRDYFGEDAKLLSYIEWIKPLALFVKNESPAHISAICVSWNFPSRDGKEKFSPQTAINFGFIYSRTLVPPENVKSYSVIPTGGEKFYSYISIPFDLMQKSKVFKNSNGGGHSYYFSSGQEKFLERPSNFLFSVDGILFSDGRFVGENRSFLFERLIATLKAERDFARKIRELKEKGMNCEEIVLKAQAESDKQSRHSITLPQNSKESFDNSYAQTVLSLRETIFRQKSSTQLSDEQIVNMAMKGLEKADFRIYKADI